MDPYSRRIVGWSLTNHMRAELVTDALKNALASRSDTKGLIFHSDRGSQYGSQACRDMLRLADLRQSMSAIANPYDNAWSESVIVTFKREVLRDGHFLTLEDAYLETSAYLDGYYNTHRLHSSLNYQTPAHFERLIALAK
jgi:putative transposase